MNNTIYYVLWSHEDNIWRYHKAKFHKETEKKITVEYIGSDRGDGKKEYSSFFRSDLEEPHNYHISNVNSFVPRLNSSGNKQSKTNLVEAKDIGPSVYMEPDEATAAAALAAVRAKENKEKEKGADALMDFASEMAGIDTLAHLKKGFPAVGEKVIQLGGRKKRRKTRKTRKTRKNKKRKSKKSKKNIKKKAPTKKRKLRKNKKTKRKKGGAERNEGTKRDLEEVLPSMMGLEFESLADDMDLEEDMKNIEQEEKRRRLETVDKRRAQEKLDQEMLGKFDRGVFSPGDDEINRIRRQRAQQQLYKDRTNPINIKRFKEKQKMLKKLAATAARPASAPALTQSRVEVDARLAREHGKLRPVDTARREANAAALRANYESALKLNQRPR